MTASTEKFSFRSDLVVSVVEPEGVCVTSEFGSELFLGPVYCHLAPLLTDGCGVDRAVEELASTFEPAIVIYAINELKTREVIEEAGRGDDSEDRAYWRRITGGKLHTFDPAGFEIGVRTLPSEDTDVILAPLRSMGFSAEMCRPGRSYDLEVVPTDSYLSPLLLEASRTHRAANTCWCPIRTRGMQALVGPIFGVGACYECLRFRLEMNRWIETNIGHRVGNLAEILAPRTKVGPLAGAVGMALALEVSHLAAGRYDQARLLTIDAVSLAIEHHALERRPQCPACGDPLLQTKIMTSQPIMVSDDGVLADPLREAVTAPGPLARFVDPWTGIVSSVVQADCPLEGVSCMTAVFGFGRDAPTLQSLNASRLSGALGVAATRKEAAELAVFEALERYSGMFQGDEPAIRARYDTLDPDEALHPNACMLYSDLQYRHRRRWNESLSAFAFVPEPFDEHSLVEWTGVWSITRSRFILVPTSYLFYFYPQEARNTFCWADSNGCATGEDLQDAIRRGLLELIERDCVAMWWYNELRRPGLDLDHLYDSHSRCIIAGHRQLGREIAVLDLTNDLGVPVFAAVSWRTTHRPQEILLGFGAHARPGIAVRRALTEMTHQLPAVTRSEEESEHVYHFPDAAHVDWWRSATLSAQPYLTPSSSIPVVQLETLEADAPVRDLRTGCSDLVARVEAAGLEVLVANMTRPDVGIPAVKVIVPGLRHFWARFAPGRLFDVPTRMGWIPVPKHESELNAIPLFV